MFHQKSVVVFGKTQAVHGTPEVLAAANAIACTEASFSPVFQSETTEYIGDVNSRDVDVSETDRHGKLDLTTFLPVLGSVGGNVNDTLALEEWLLACGAVKSTGVGDAVIFSNAVLTPTEMTQEFRRSDSKSANDKVFTLVDSLATVDLEIQAKKKGTLKFSFLGEYSFAADKPHLTADYEGQKTYVAPVAATGEVNVSWKSLPCCAETFSASNFFGVAVERVLTLCNDSFYMAASTSEVTIQILEKYASATFNPEAHLHTSGALVYQLGTVAGKKVSINMSDLLLTEWQPANVGNYAGMSLKFVNKGTSSLVFS